MYLAFVQGPNHKFSYISLVLQLTLCHGQYIIMSDLHNDYKSSVSRVAAFLNTRPIQVRTYLLKDIIAVFW